MLCTLNGMENGVQVTGVRERHFGSIISSSLYTINKHYSGVNGIRTLKSCNCSVKNKFVLTLYKRRTKGFVVANISYARL